MKQLLQDARTGDLNVAEIPEPQLLPGCVLVRVAASLVSSGTERASAEFASKNLFSKAKARPDLVRDVLSKLRRDGIASTWQAVRSRLDQPQTVGYSSAGVIVGVGEGVTDLAVGDRVACAGAGYAVHAESACIPRLLVAKIPETGNVTFEEAAFATVGAICLHGIRTAQVELGDTIAVIGLGLLGQITVQLLRAAGCHVFGLDLMPSRAGRALTSGSAFATTSAEQFRDACMQRTDGAGVDAVLITAETPSSEPVNLAAEIARDRAIVVAVGTIGMELERKRFYEKELDFRISRSYGPGRYDAAYEQKGRDYPIGHVRWTETRNMTAFLQFVADRKLNLHSLITHRFPIDAAPQAYALISGRRDEDSLGVLLEYPSRPSQPSGESSSTVVLSSCKPIAGRVGIGVIGAGSFATNILLPILKQLSDAELIGVASATGAHSHHAGRKFGFKYCSNSTAEILSDADVHAVVIASRHDLHAEQVLAALAAGKAVFCEKPLCLTEDELSQIASLRLAHENNPLLMVGFNRRFAPMASALKQFVSEIHEPLAIHYRVNAGFIPSDHWVNDPEQGGGRILGEVCHFVDFACFLAGASPSEVHGKWIGNRAQYSGDNVVASLAFPDGTVATITYLANGDRAASKERIEVFGGGSTAILEDFRYLELVRHGRKQVSKSRWRQDKGHREELKTFVQAVSGNAPEPIPFEQILGSSLTTIRLQQSCQTGATQQVDLAEFVSPSLRQQNSPAKDTFA